MASPEIMKRIVEAEKDSERALQEAEREIAQTKKDLPNRIAEMRDKIFKEATSQRERELVEAERAGAAEAERITMEAKKQVEGLSKTPEARRKQAVEKAIQLILS